MCYKNHERMFNKTEKEWVEVFQAWQPGVTEDTAYEVMGQIYQKLMAKGFCCLDQMVALQEDTDRMVSELRAAGVEFIRAAS